MRRRETDPFAGMRRPELPGGLKHRMLARARREAVTRRSLVDRLWESQRLRWAWAASCVALLAVQLMLAAPGTTATGPAARGVTPIGTSEPDFEPFLARHPMRETPDTLRLHSFQFFVPHTVDDSHS